MKKSVATLFAMATLALVTSGCASTGDPHVYQGGPVGGMVQQHGGENPTPIIFPRSQAY
ncbi:hypothetical protein [Rhizobium oryzicola]|uniref:Lipoprotein n=1 Tax=Rhizobium oryzicola TaxID=1232668 RepID=A0ABT8T177_9HYPH|nr:hypothetical protein [Rhizobium oryzicola]MDO1584396.1 hypothetical protein [Rhizobium oryzicola]